MIEKFLARNVLFEMIQLLKYVTNRYLLGEVFNEEGNW